MSDSPETTTVDALDVQGDDASIDLAEAEAIHAAPDGRITELLHGEVPEWTASTPS